MNESEYSALLQKTKLPIPMKGIEVKIFSAVFLILVFGIVWSISTDNWESFARSGSLVVIVGIYLVWRDFVSLIGDVREMYSETIQEYLRILDDLPTFDSTKPGGIISQAMAKGEQRREIEDKDARALILFDTLRQRVRTTEAIILALGTFIWGFGSLVPTILNITNVT